MSKSYPSAISDIVANCFKRNLKNGLKLRNEILSSESKTIEDEKANVMT